MVERQTRWIQNPLSERACGFKSRSGHQPTFTSTRARAPSLRTTASVAAGRGLGSNLATGPTRRCAEPLARHRRPRRPGVPSNAVPPTAYTVGHGTRTTEELVAVLRSVGVGRLLDVRRHPGSNRHPHLAEGPLR